VTTSPSVARPASARLADRGPRHRERPRNCGDDRVPGARRSLSSDPSTMRSATSLSRAVGAAGVAAHRLERPVHRHVETFRNHAFDLLERDAAGECRVELGGAQLAGGDHGFLQQTDGGHVGHGLADRQVRLGKAAWFGPEQVHGPDGLAAQPGLLICDRETTSWQGLTHSEALDRLVRRMCPDVVVVVVLVLVAAWDWLVALLLPGGSRLGPCIGRTRRRRAPARR
jgi:hypothetical protein